MLGYRDYDFYKLYGSQLRNNLELGCLAKIEKYERPRVRREP